MIKPYGFQLSDWLEAIFSRFWLGRSLSMKSVIRTECGVWDSIQVKFTTCNFERKKIGSNGVADWVRIPASTPSSWVSREVSPVSYSSSSLSTKNKTLYFQFDLEPTNGLLTKANYKALTCRSYLRTYSPYSFHVKDLIGATNGCFLSYIFSEKQNYLKFSIGLRTAKHF